MAIDWDGLEATTYETLREVLAQEHQAFGNGGDDLKALAVRVVEYWKRQMAGEVLGGNIVDGAVHQARYLCTLYNCDVQGRAVRVAKLLRSFIYMGEGFLRNMGEERGKAKNKS